MRSPRMMNLAFNAFLSALLVYLSFPNYWSVYGFWPLAWVSIIPLLKSLEGQGLAKRFCIGFFYGLILYTALLLWLFPVHVPGASAFVIAMSIQPVLFCVFYSRTITRLIFDHQSPVIAPLPVAPGVRPGRPQAEAISLPIRLWFNKLAILRTIPNDVEGLRSLRGLKMTKPVFNILFVPALWAASEWARTMVLGGFAWGMAYSQSFQPALIQFAAWAGLYGVSFVIVLVNVLLCRCLRARDMQALAAAILAMVLLLASGQLRLSTLESGNPIVSVAAVQPNIPPDKKLSDQDFDDNIRLHEDLTTKSVARQKPDVIVWPETAFPADISKDRYWYPLFSNIARENNALFVFGAVPVVDGKSYNSAFVLDQSGTFAGAYDKQFLVPLNEFKPGGLLGLLRPLFEGYGFDFSAGVQPGLFSNRDGEIRFGLMICSETCYPSLARKLSNGHALWMIAILNDGWFARSEAVMMHAQNAVFRAVETGRDILSVGNTGWTGVINAHGVMRHDQQLPLQRQGQGVFQVSSRQEETLYSKIGDFFAGACVLFVIIFLILQKTILREA